MKIFTSSAPQSGEGNGPGRRKEGPFCNAPKPECRVSNLLLYLHIDIQHERKDNNRADTAREMLGGLESHRKDAQFSRVTKRSSVSRRFLNNATS